MQAALNHLRKADPVLGSIITRVGDYRPFYREPRFETLVRAVVFQQLSGKAASTIYGRLEAACDGAITPTALLKLKPRKLRSAGLSRQKSSYVRDLARQTHSGKLDFSRLRKMDDAEVIAALTQVKGVGVWTAQMFLLFALRRPNVLPVGDLGVQTAIRRAYGKRKVTPQTVEKVGRAWHPHCSVAAWYLWRSLEKR